MRCDAGRRGEGLAGCVLRVDTTRNLEPGRCVTPGRGEVAVLDEGDDGPGEEGAGTGSGSNERTEDGRDAGSGGS